MSVTWLKFDARRRETRLWEKWLNQVPKIRNEFKARWGDDPLSYNETASVSVLASAANRSNLLALSEYVSIKLGPGRGRAHRNGRCDLWVGDPKSRVSWAFELKQNVYGPTPREDTIRELLTSACEDADDVHTDEANIRFGGVLVSALSSTPFTDKGIAHVTQIADEATFSFRIEGGDGPVWLILKQI